MDDPFYRTNEYDARAMSEEDCTLYATFPADEQTLAAPRQVLRF